MPGTPGGTVNAEQNVAHPGAQTTWPRFACPRCRRPLRPLVDGWVCEQDNLSFTRDAGIPSFILPDERSALERFLETYRLIRQSDGWGHASPEYVRHLPYRDVSGKHRGVWAIRARTYDAFVEHLHRQQLRTTPRVLDIGSGNCWLSARMALGGSHVVALDISLDPGDGLGALEALPQALRAMISPVRADFNSLPFVPGEFDLIILNASLHYSSDPLRTLSGAMEALDRDGILYILDSPFYTETEAGEKMLREWHRDFERRFNRPAPEPGPRGYLTLEMFAHIATRYRAEQISPDYGIRWALRPYVARLLRRRQPASFGIVAVRKR